MRLLASMRTSMSGWASRKSISRGTSHSEAKPIEHDTVTDFVAASPRMAAAVSVSTRSASAAARYSAWPAGVSWIAR